MRLVYLSQAAIPSRSSNGTQTMRMCAAFAEAGATVTLVHSKVRQPPPEGFTGDVAAFYGLRTAFERRTLPATVGFGGPRIRRVARTAPYLTYLIQRMRPQQPPFVVYARSFVAGLAAVRARQVWGRCSACRAVVIEVHDEPPVQAWPLLRAVDGVVAISNALRRRLVEMLPEIRTGISVEHDGVDLGAGYLGIEQSDARAQLGVEPRSGPVVVYAGRAIAGKGVDVLIEAAEHLKGIGAHILVVGRVYEREYPLRAPDNVTFTGFVAPSDVPVYLAAGDVMVMPTTPDLAYAAYTSPLKLFEYMATGKPVVVSDLPVLREIIRHAENGFVYPPRDAAALAAAVRRLWSEPAVARALADQALRDVQYHSWHARASRILGYLERAAT